MADRAAILSRFPDTSNRPQIGPRLVFVSQLSCNHDLTGSRISTKAVSSMLISPSTVLRAWPDNRLFSYIMCCSVHAPVSYPVSAGTHCSVQSARTIGPSQLLVHLARRLAPHEKQLVDLLVSCSLDAWVSLSCALTVSTLTGIIQAVQQDLSFIV